MIVIGSATLTGALMAVVVMRLLAARYEIDAIDNSDTRLEVQKRATICQCGCAYRHRPPCTNNHAFTATHSLFRVHVRCWHCDYHRTVGSRRKIRTVAAVLAAHDDLLAMEEYRNDLLEFEAYRKKLMDER